MTGKSYVQPRFNWNFILSFIIPRHMTYDFNIYFIGHPEAKAARLAAIEEGLRVSPEKHQYRKGATLDIVQSALGKSYSFLLENTSLKALLELRRLEETRAQAQHDLETAEARLADKYEDVNHKYGTVLEFSFPSTP